MPAVCSKAAKVRKRPAAAAAANVRKRPAATATADLQDPLSVIDGRNTSASCVEEVARAMITSLPDTAFDSCKRLLKELSQSGKLSYGSDCTCLDAPWVALGLLQDVFAEHGTEIAWQRLSGSEDPGPGGNAPRLLMELNGRPSVLFDDMVDRSDGFGFCRYRGERVRIPVVTDYSAGYVCKD